MWTPSIFLRTFLDSALPTGAAALQNDPHQRIEFSNPNPGRSYSVGQILAGTVKRAGLEGGSLALPSVRKRYLRQTPKRSGESYLLQQLLVEISRVWREIRCDAVAIPGLGQSPNGGCFCDVATSRRVLVRPLDCVALIAKEPDHRAGRDNIAPPFRGRPRKSDRVIAFGLHIGPGEDRE